MDWIWLAKVAVAIGGNLAILAGVVVVVWHFSRPTPAQVQAAKQRRQCAPCAAGIYHTQHDSVPTGGN